MLISSTHCRKCYISTHPRLKKAFEVYYSVSQTVSLPIDKFLITCSVYVYIYIYIYIYIYMCVCVCEMTGDCCLVTACPCVMSVQMIISKFSRIKQTFTRFFFSIIIPPPPFPQAVVCCKRRTCGRWCFWYRAPSCR